MRALASKGLAHLVKTFQDRVLQWCDKGHLVRGLVLHLCSSYWRAPESITKDLAGGEFRQCDKGHLVKGAAPESITKDLAGGEISEHCYKRHIVKGTACGITLVLQ